MKIAQLREVLSTVQRAVRLSLHSIIIFVREAYKSCFDISYPNAVTLFVRLPGQHLLHHHPMTALYESFIWDSNISTANEILADSAVHIRKSILIQDWTATDP